MALQRARGRCAEIGIDAALHDAEQGVAGRAAEMRRATARAQRIDNCMDARASSGVAGKRRAFVQHHGDGGVQQMLDLDRACRRQTMGATVEMRLEGDAVGVELAQLGQRHDLEAAGIGQDRAEASP